MGEYRVKSGQSLPGLRNTKLPGMPKRGSLKHNPPKSEENAEVDALSDVIKSDGPTDVHSADDILAAVGGIDGWDNMSDSGNPNAEVPSLSESIDSIIPDEDEDNTKVSERSSKLASAAEFILTENQAPENGLADAGGQTSSIESMEEMESSKTEMVESPFMNPELAAAIAATPISKPIAIPSNAQAEAPAPEIAPTMAISVSPAEISSQVPAANPAAVSAQVPAANPATVSAQVPAANHAAVSAQVPAAPPMPSGQMRAASSGSNYAVQSAPSAQPQPAAPQRELSDEEQMQALLESMTPEERMEYERYCLEQQQQQIEQRRAKQRELMEMYGLIMPKPLTV